MDKPLKIRADELAPGMVAWLSPDRGWEVVERVYTEMSDGQWVYVLASSVYRRKGSTLVKVQRDTDRKA